MNFLTLSVGHDRKRARLSREWRRDSLRLSQKSKIDCVLTCLLFPPVLRVSRCSDSATGRARHLLPLDLLLWVGLFAATRWLCLCSHDFHESYTDYTVYRLYMKLTDGLVQLTVVRIALVPQVPSGGLDDGVQRFKYLRGQALPWPVAELVQGVRVNEADCRQHTMTLGPVPAPPMPCVHVAHEDRAFCHLQLRCPPFGWFLSQAWRCEEAACAAHRVWDDPHRAHGCNYRFYCHTC